MMEQGWSSVRGQNEEEKVLLGLDGKVQRGDL